MGGGYILKPQLVVNYVIISLPPPPPLEFFLLGPAAIPHSLENFKRHLSICSEVLLTYLLGASPGNGS